MPRIHIQNIIANYFEHNPKAERVSLEIIHDICKKAVKLLNAQNMDVSPANTYNDVNNMFNTNDDIFEKDDNTDDIVLINREKLQKEIFFYFNPRIDSAIKDTYLDIMETLCQAA